MKKTEHNPKSVLIKGRKQNTKEENEGQRITIKMRLRL